MVANEAGNEATRADGPPAPLPDDTLRVPVLRPPPAERRPSRMSRRARIVAYVVIAAFVAVAAGGWGYVMMFARGNPQVGGEVVSFVRDSPTSLTITFDVYKPADRAAACRLRALDLTQHEVGSREIVIPAGESDVTTTQRLATSAEAFSGSVQYCYLVQ